MSNLRKILAVGVVLAACAAIVTYLGFDIVGRAMQMVPAKTDASTYQAAKSGARIKAIVVVETRQSDGAVTGHLLVPVTETTYRKTPTLVRAQVVPAMRVIMGTPDDVKPGAVAQFDGVADGAGGMTLSRVVILSAYVHVAS